MPEEQLHRLCDEHVLSWDTMTEDEREEFIDALAHEDRLKEEKGAYIDDKQSRTNKSRRV